MQKSQFVSRGGRVTKWKGRVASIAPYMLFASVSVAALGAIPAHADILPPQIIPDSQSGFDFEVLTGDTVSNDGTLDNFAIDVQALDYSADMTINGTLDVLVDGFNAGEIEFVNEGVNHVTDNGNGGANATAVASKLVIDGFASAIGIKFENDTATQAAEGNLSGTLTNNGAITVYATAYDTAYADATAGATAYNAKKVHASAYATAVAGGARAAGIGVQGTLSGDILNSDSGTITVTAMAGYNAEATATASAYAHSANKTATATASAQAYAGSAAAAGIYARLDLSGNVTNQGDITVLAMGGDDARAYASIGFNLNDGVRALGPSKIANAIGYAGAHAGYAYAAGIIASSARDGDGDLSGAVSNDGGTISITALAGSGGVALAGIGVVSAEYATKGEEWSYASATAGNAEAYWVDARDDLTGTVSNSGTVDVLAVGGADSTARAFKFGLGIGTGNHLVSSSVGAVVSAYAGGAYAYGISAGNDIGTVDNSGVLNVTSYGGDFGYASAIAAVAVAGNYVSVGFNRSVHQSAIAVVGQAAAYGVDAGADLSNVTNGGTINVLAVAGSPTLVHAAAYASIAFNAYGTASVSGNVHASGGGAEAYGIYAAGDLTDLGNSGTINVSAVGGFGALGYASAGFDFAFGYMSASVDVSLEMDVGKATAVGIEADGSLGGTLTNADDGVLNVLAVGGGLNHAAGLLGLSYASGIENASLSMSASAVAGDAEATGIGFGADLAGTLDNSGTINVTAVDIGFNGAAVYQSFFFFYAPAPFGALALGYQSVEGRIQLTANAGNAQAFGISVGNDLTGSLSNSGTISATALTNLIGYNSAFAVANGVTAARGSHNHAQMSVEVAAGNATAIGIDVGGRLSNSLSNSGTILATADVGGPNIAYLSGGNFFLDDAVVRAYGSGYNLASGHFSIAAGNASAIGIDIHDDISSLGTLDNSGSIVVNASGGSNNLALSYISGIQAFDGPGPGIYSTALAKADIAAYAGNAYGAGIHIGDDVQGSLTNSGSIGVVVRGGNDNSAEAVLLDVAALAAGGLYGSAYASASAAAYAGAGNAHAYGVDIEDNVSSNGSVDNTGTINVTAVGGSSNRAVAIVGAYASALATFGIVYSTVHAEVTALAGNAYAYGISVGHDLDGTLSNSGSIIVSAIGGDGNRASADVIDGDLEFQVGEARARGIYVAGVMTGQLSNSGSITATATGGQDNYFDGNPDNVLADARAYGIKIGSSSGGIGQEGELTSTGNIFAEATAFDGANAEAYGIRVENMDEGSTVDLSGRIVARVIDADNPGNTVAEDAYAVWLGGSELDPEMAPLAFALGPISQPTQGIGTAVFRSPLFLEGKIHVEQENVTLESGPGMSVNWTFEDADPGVGIYKLKGPLPWYGKDVGTDHPSYATYDPTGLASQANVISDIADTVSRLGDYGLSKATDKDKHFWIAGIGSQRSYDGDSITSLDQNVRSNSVALGASFDVNSQSSVTVLGGYNWGKMEEDGRQTTGFGGIDTSGGFAAIYGRMTTQDVFTFGGGLAGGMFSQDNNRTVNNNDVWGGVDKLDSNTDGYWISPEIWGSFNYDLTSMLAVRPTVIGRYIYGNVGGYSEGGKTDSAAKVGDQNVNVLEIEANAMLDLNTGYGILSLGGGYLYRGDNSDSSVDVSIFGVNQGMPVDATDRLSPYAQAAYSVNIVDSLTIDLNGRLLFPQEGDMGADAMAKLKWNF